MADLGHLAHRVPDGRGHPAETDRRHEAQVADVHHQLAAQAYVGMLSDGDAGGAVRHLHSLQHDLAPHIDPWRLVEHVAKLALRRAGATAHSSG